MNLSIVIPVHNDPDLADTLISLVSNSTVAKTIKHNWRVIVVDDGSTPPATIDPDLARLVTLIRLDQQRGPAVARQIGAAQSTGEWLLFLDSHMRFAPNWDIQICRYTDEILRPNDAACAVYRSNVIFNSFWHDTHRIGGADFFLWKHQVEEGQSTYSFADLLPRRATNQFGVIPCVIGASYLVSRKWFMSIGGYTGLVGYGCEEQMLSLGTWLNGGTVQLMGDLDVTHVYQGKQPRYQQGMFNSIIANRLRVLASILTEQQFASFYHLLPVADISAYGKVSRMPWQRVMNYDELAEKFGLQSYREATDLMAEYNQCMKGDSHV